MAKATSNRGQQRVREETSRRKVGERRTRRRLRKTIRRTAKELLQLADASIAVGDYAAAALPVTLANGFLLAEDLIREGF